MTPIALLTFAVFVTSYAAPLQTANDYTDQTIVNGSTKCIIQNGNLTVNGVQKGPLTLAQQDELKQYQLNVDQWTLSIKGVMHEAMNEPATTSAAAPQNIPNNPTQQNEQSAHTKNMKFYVGTNTEINSNGIAGTSGSLHYDGAVMVTQASVNAAMQLPVPEIPSFCRV